MGELNTTQICVSKMLVKIQKLPTYYCSSLSHYSRYRRSSFSTEGTKSTRHLVWLFFFFFFLYNIQASPCFFHSVGSIATCCHFMRAVLLILLVHRSGGLPTSLVVGGLQIIIILIQCSSVIHAMCPAQLHFSDFFEEELKPELLYG